MAFVYRTVEKQNSPKVSIPGPGAYFKRKKQLESSEPQHRVPFNHSENRQIWKMHLVPGPGAYDTETGIKKQKKLISDPLNNVVIYETPSQSVAFKSKTNRFSTNGNSQNPGPGEYETDPEAVRPQSGFKKPKNQSSQLKQFLKQKNNLYKNGDDDFINLKDMVVTAKDQLFNDSFTQGKNNEIENKKGSKNSLFFASKVQRDVNKIRPQTSAGPGSYNIAKSSFEIEKKYPKKNPVKSICIDKRVEKVQTEEVGPGYYDLDQAFKTMSKFDLAKKKKLECFGSTVDRFQILKTEYCSMNPGPTTYSLQNISVSKNKKSKIPGTSFPKGERKIFEPPKSAVLPISYNSVQDFSSAKKQKYERKPSAKECFGSTKERFVQKENHKVQFSNTCINESMNLIFSRPLECKVNENKGKFYKTLLNTRQKKKRFEQNISSSQPKIESSPNIDRPLCYDNETNTFASKYGYKVQKQAPFMSGAERFKDNNHERFIDLNVDESKNLRNGKGRSSPQERTGLKRSGSKKETDGKVGWMAVSKDERFKYPAKKDPVSPQYYDPTLPQKRSYNVLFVESYK